MRDVDHDEIRERKDICGGCGAPLRKVGEIDGKKRGDEFECSRKSCGYTEWRMYGDGYYEIVEE